MTIKLTSSFGVICITEIRKLCKLEIGVRLPVAPPIYTGRRVNKISRKSNTLECCESNRRALPSDSNLNAKEAGISYKKLGSLVIAVIRKTNGFVDNHNINSIYGIFFLKSSGC